MCTVLLHCPKCMLPALSLVQKLGASCTRVALAAFECVDAQTSKSETDGVLGLKDTRN